MDDLTQIHGIGAKTAEKLVKAGIDSFALLAAATPNQLNATKVAGSPADWQGFIDAAKALSSPREMTETELAALVKSWDDARTALSTAGDQVVEIQALIGALPADADRTDLEAQLAEAQAAVAKAHDAIATLTPLPDGVRLPDARPAAAAPAEQVVTSERDALTNDLGSDATESVEQILSGFIDTVEGRDLTRITVIGPVAGRRRAGFEFNGTPRTILVTPDELEAIRADAALAVSTAAPSENAAMDVEAGIAALAAPGFDFAGAGSIAVRVLGPAKGRRRAGFEFGAEAKTVEVTPDQLALLRSDPDLAVSPA